MADFLFTRSASRFPRMNSRTSSTPEPGTRWPERECVSDWSQGIPLEYVQVLARYWTEEYDWRAREARLNSFDQFVTEIDGLDIHFIHQRSANPDALLLLITHGWPGSIVEFAKVIEPLSRDFHLGARRCPASGSPVSRRPRDGRSSGSHWPGDTLMKRLGYDRYGAQGGDWGRRSPLRSAGNSLGCTVFTSTCRLLRPSGT